MKGKAGLFILLVILMVLLPESPGNKAMANGGPLDGGDTNILGTLLPIQNTDIVCQDEKMVITLGLYKASVKITYTFLNTGKSQTVKYGFPIVEGGIENFSGSKTEVNTIQQINKAYHYAISDNGKQLAFVPTDANLADWGYDPNEFGSVQIPHLKLLVSNITFKTGETKTVTVSYTQSYAYTDGFSSKDLYPHLGQRKFYYTLETGRYWKDGIIRNAEISIDAGAIPGEVPVIIKPSGYTVSAGTNTSKNRLYFMHYTDFKPTKDHNLSISIDIGVWYLNRIKEYERLDSQNHIVDIKKAMKSIAASSVLAPSGGYSYDPENAIDGNYFGTVWAAKETTEGSIGESITIIFKKPMKIRKVGIIPGVFLTKELYWANNRISDVEIQYLNIKGNKVSQIIKTDTFAYHNGSLLGIEKEVEPPFESPFDCILWGYNPQEIMGYSFPYPPPTMCGGISIIVKAVNKGTTYNDTCIGEIIMVSSDTDIIAWAEKLVYGE